MSSSTGDGFRSGFAAIVGRPNVGKSTLLNALIEHPISIVTPKPQTTRHRILGIRNEASAQIIFVDTPGLHRGARKAMNRHMNRTAAQALAEADVVLFLTEALVWKPEDEDVLRQIRAAPGQALLVVNKIDSVRPRSRLLPWLTGITERSAIPEAIPVSALRGENLPELVAQVRDRLPESPALFPAGQLTDRSERFLAAEIIREKLTWKLQQELPYGLTVEVEQYEEQEGRLLIGAVIWVERKGQKPIVIGRAGEGLKETGRAARLALRALTGRSVHLELWVKVKENWSDNERALRDLGYELQ